MTDRLADAVAVVTGGGRGIGAATCRRLAAEGADVVAVDIDADSARETADVIRGETDSEALAVGVDVSDEAAVERLVRRVDERFGRVDVLVNNAAIRVEPKPVTRADEESWDRILDVNLKGAAFSAKHLIPLMSRNAGAQDDGKRPTPGGLPAEAGYDGRGAIVNVASNGYEVARPEWSQYDATKGAMVSMTRDMACDHAPDGIRVNAVSPGWVITEYHTPDDPEAARAFRERETTPNADGPGILKRAADPAEVAAAIAFLASPDASFVTGTVLRVDGGVGAVGKGFDWDPDG